MNPTTIRSRPRQPPLIYILTCLYLIQSLKKNINLLIDILGFDLGLEEYEEQKKCLTCRICTENPVSVVFLPCSHLVCCLDCAPAMRKCPICHELVKGTIKTFFSWYLVLVSIYCKNIFVYVENLLSLISWVNYTTNLRKHTMKSYLIWCEYSNLIGWSAWRKIGYTW